MLRAHHRAVLYYAGLALLIFLIFLTAVRIHHDQIEEQYSMFKPNVVLKDETEFQDYPSATLKLHHRNVPIYILDEDINDFNVKHTLLQQPWERHWLNQLQESLQGDGSLHFVDIGSSTGIYSVAAASMGRKVLAVDGNIENLMRLRKTGLREHFAERITLVNNAVSDHHGIFVVNDVVRKHFDREDKPYWIRENKKVDAILLDDLLSAVRFSRCVLMLHKTDHGLAILRGAKQLFSALDIPLVLMYWGTNRSAIEAGRIIKIFHRLGYYASTDVLGKKKLPENWRRWPRLVNWVKKRTK